jgi:hypothetical protein
MSHQCDPMAHTNPNSRCRPYVAGGDYSGTNLARALERGNTSLARMIRDARNRHTGFVPDYEACARLLAPKDEKRH